MSRTLPRRLFIGGALGGVVVALLIIIGLRTMLPALQTASVERRISGIDHSACNAAPKSWGWSSGDISYFAYDRAGRSENPAAPQIEQRLLRRALAEEQAALEFTSNRILVVVPHWPDGPCAVFRATWKNPLSAVLSPIRRVMAGAIVVGMLLAVLGTFLLVVRPLQSRIEEVATAARSVGSESFTPPPTTSDELGHIAEVLARSHDRILNSRNALEERNQALEQHLAGIAHDLRTPLSSMHLALESLAAESRGSAGKEAQRALADAVYLSSLVENLHQATRLRHEVDITSGSVELTDLVHRLEKRFAIVGRHAGVEVAGNTPEDKVWVACTPALAERAVANVVQNAVEHNDGSGHVAITLSLVASGSRFQLVVADDGPGLPQDALATLQNESFLEDEARPRGPGLGTLITKEVALRAGWSVSYGALEPKGLEVRIEGPVIDPD